MNVTLVPKDKKEQALFLAKSKNDYAQSLAKAFDIEWSAALEDAEKSVKSIFKPKKDIVLHKFYSAFDQSINQYIGDVWLTLNVSKQKAYLYEIVIEEGYRGKGYGKMMMSLLHDYCKEKGMSKIELAVFGWNKVAYRLYKNAGYDMVRCSMQKQL